MPMGWVTSCGIDAILGAIERIADGQAVLSSLDEGHVRLTAARASDRGGNLLEMVKGELGGSVIATLPAAGPTDEYRTAWASGFL